jgi:hypothetical protein
MLSLTSFVNQGHQTEMYSYDTSFMVPPGGRVRYASEFIPQRQIYFHASDADALETSADAIETSGTILMAFGRTVM